MPSTAVRPKPMISHKPLLMMANSRASSVIHSRPARCALSVYTTEGDGTRECIGRRGELLVHLKIMEFEMPNTLWVMGNVLS